ncbi:transposase [Paludisphaera soli]|uniref:transposase n=1 Tax=Paludisphaera soli TaxID=2712865 RepID=UPI0013EAC00B|nr:transposase [Paludisphaera soli]
MGADGLLSPGGERLAVLAGVHDSFARAQRLMGEMLGWAPPDDVIRRETHAAARRAAAERPGRRDAGRFAVASGAVELEVDAGKVPTTGGWRDVKVAVFARREPGDPTPVDEWADRRLPPPSIRSAVAAVEGAGDFAGRVRREADRLRATTAADATVLGDGAEWIWNLAAEVLPQAEGVLDVFHAVEHIGDAVKAAWPAPVAAGPRREAGVAALLAEGKPGVDRWIAGLFAELPAGCDGVSLRALSAYLASHPTRLGHADRLARGRWIGSGMVEGAIKQLVNRRMKRTGARWRVEHVGPLVELVALADQPEWHDLWAA